MRYTIRPISDRSAFGGARQASQFTVTYSQAEDLLDRELVYLHAKDIVIEIDVAEHGIRMDGTLRADARAATSAIRIAFESEYGALTYATDRFYRDRAWAYVGTGDNRRRQDTMRHGWQHNLYAIALGLEALRKVDRYGITKRGEQYTGWKALPPGTGAIEASHMTSDQARQIIMDASMDEPSIAWPAPTETERWKLAFKMARARVHPDRNDGDRALWDKVEQAARTLGIAS